jgi:hypothetical protein
MDCGIHQLARTLTDAMDYGTDDIIEAECNDWVVEDGENYHALMRRIQKAVRKAVPRISAPEGPTRDSRVQSTPQNLNGAQAEFYADDALSLGVFEEACKDPSVRRFRQEYLLDRLIHSPEELERALCEFNLQDAQRDGATLSRDWLPYITHSMRDRERPAIQIHEQGVLRELFRLCQDLGRKYQFSIPQAVDFILWPESGLRPLLMGSTIRLEANEGIPELTRIILSVHPRATTREVADLYGRWRTKMGFGERRKLKDKTAELAHFVVMQRAEYERECRRGPIDYGDPELNEWARESHRRRPRQMPWRQILDVWNRRFPEWAYAKRLPDLKLKQPEDFQGVWEPLARIEPSHSDLRRFIRDAINALKALEDYYKLTHEELERARGVMR